MPLCEKPGECSRHPGGPMPENADPMSAREAALLDFIERGITAIERGDQHIRPDDGPDGFVAGYRWPKVGSWHRILQWKGMAAQITAARRTGRDIAPILDAISRTKQP